MTYNYGTGLIFVPIESYKSQLSIGAKNQFHAINIAPGGIDFLMRCEKCGDNALGIFGKRS